MRRSKVIRQEKVLRKRIAIARRSGDQRAYELAINNYLNSFAAKFCAAEKAKRECKRKTCLSAEKMAEEMDVWGSCDEVIHITASHKNRRSDGTARFILSFGPKNQARQILVKNAIYHPENLADGQALTQGGGPAAIRRAQRFYEEGYRHVSELDIRRCYPSFASGRSGQLLALSERVTENVLTLVNSVVTLSNTCVREQLHLDENSPYDPEEIFVELYGADFSYAQQGLIEGSKLSPFIVEMLLAPVCRNLQASGLGKVVNYADNFLLMARSHEELIGLEAILQDELRTHPVGALSVREDITRFAPGETFDFLGYRLEPQGDRLTPWIGRKSEKKLKNLRQQAYKELNSVMLLYLKRRKFETMQKEHRSILRGLPCFEGKETYHELKMRPLRETIEAQETARRPRIRRRSVASQAN